LKKNIVESIQTVKEAHLKVIMCTGDNLDTAKSIAVDAGIIDPRASED
jgi:P-type E1-E2 ATPase